MRILIYGINFHPELTGTGKNNGLLAQWFAQQGHDVRMVTAPPFYPAWKVSDGYRASTYRREVLLGVTVYRCPVWVPRRQSGMKRLLHHASYAASSLPVMLAQAGWRPHLVISIAPPLLAAPTAWLTARLCRAGAWLNVKDFEVDAAFELGLLRGRALRRLALAGESWLLRRFDRVSSISPAMVARLRAKGMPSERAIYFPNWVETDTIFPDSAARASMRAQLGLRAEHVLALYSGNLGAKQGLEIIPQAAALVRNPHVVVLVCGDGGGRAALEAAAHELPQLWVRPLQPAERLNALLNAADIHVLPQQRAAADLVLPGKLLYMLSSGGMIVATAAADTDVGRLVHAGGGELTPPGDAAALAARIDALAADPERRAAGRRAAHSYALRHLGKDAVLSKLLVDLQPWLGTAASDAPQRSVDVRRKNELEQLP